MEYVVPLLLQFSLSSPLFVVWIVGIVLAALRMRENPARYRLVVIALVVLLILNIVGTTISLLTPIIMARNGLSTAELGFRLGWVHLLSTLLSAGAWVLLLLALFWRTAR